MAAVAEELAAEAVDMLEELAIGNPRHLPTLAKAMNNLGVYTAALGQHRKALQMAEAAETIIRRLARGNSGFAPDLAAACTNLATRLGDAGRVQEAVVRSEEAVGIWRRLASVFPARYLADSLRNTANHCRILGRDDSAAAYHRERARILIRLQKGPPETPPS
jgi:tetratricopeptide (TPR) repeat protein